MPQLPVELILLRQWASYISMPIWVMDTDGSLIYYNEPAGRLLGREYDLSEPVSYEEVETLYHTRRLDGTPFENSELPIVIALTEGHASHGRMMFMGLDKKWRAIDVTAFPVKRPGGEALGAVAIFWETGSG